MNPTTTYVTLVPTGTITFLFTDIEGSTKLWEAHPDAMRLAVARHDALLREAVDANNGYLFKTTGDGIAAFGLASDALVAALTAQRSLTAEPNRSARLMAAGHGGQTLLSDVTHELCRDNLPLDVSLLPPGEQRLKNLSRPETVFQLVHPALVAPFPHLRTLDITPNNLPEQVTSFVGREKPLAEVAGFLGKTRLLTLTGSGGSGKTRLSLQALPISHSSRRRSSKRRVATECWNPSVSTPQSGCQQAEKLLIWSRGTVPSSLHWPW